MNVGSFIESRKTVIGCLESEGWAIDSETGNEVVLNSVEQPNHWVHILKSDGYSIYAFAEDTDLDRSLCVPISMHTPIKLPFGVAMQIMELAVCTKMIEELG